MKVQVEQGTKRVIQELKANWRLRLQRRTGLLFMQRDYCGCRFAVLLIVGPVDIDFFGLEWFP